MRYLLSVSLLGLMASGALADEFTLDSTVSAVTVYPAGATITRAAGFDIPAGRHKIIISDIPYLFAQETLRVTGAKGLVFGATQIRRARAAAEGAQLAQRQQLETEIDSLKQQIRDLQEQAAAAGLVINAANARIKLLESIGGQQAQGAANALESGTISAETLTALVSLVGQETLTALQDAQAARVEISQINRNAEDAGTRLQKAEAALALLSEPSDWRYVISFDVEAAEDTAGEMQISYVAPDMEAAGWRPVYDFRLDTEAGQLEIDRKIELWQSTGEAWTQAQITVSTAAPLSFESFSLPYSNVARYSPPAPVLMRSDAEAGLAAPTMVVVEAPAQMAAPRFAMQGITATYILPEGTVISGAAEGYEPALIPIDTSRFDAEITARANMGSANTTGFVIAAFTNTGGAPFLPGKASYFRDGAFVRGGGYDDEIDLIAAGATAILDFGPINGLQIGRRTLRREDGSSGVLTTSNDRVVEYELSVENVSDRPWDVIIYDRVPVSEQEELVVDWTARPRPSETDVDGRRGVLAWAFPLASGAGKTIKLTYELQWPDGNELRVSP